MADFIDLIDAVQALSNRDIIDFLSIILPIFLSAIAIIISLSSTIKQNKISVFKLRYDVLINIKRILSFDLEIHGCKEANLILKLYSAEMLTDIIGKNKDETLQNLICSIKKMKSDILMGEILFEEEDMEDIESIIDALYHVMFSAIEGNIDGESQEKLHILCVQYYETEFKQLVKNTKIGAV